MTPSINISLSKNLLLLFLLFVVAVPHASAVFGSAKKSTKAQLPYARPVTHGGYRDDRNSIMEAKGEEQFNELTTQEVASEYILLGGVSRDKEATIHESTGDHLVEDKKEEGEENIKQEPWKEVTNIESFNTKIEELLQHVKIPEKIRDIRKLQNDINCNLLKAQIAKTQYLHGVSNAYTQAASAYLEQAKALFNQDPYMAERQAGRAFHFTAAAECLTSENPTIRQSVKKCLGQPARDLMLMSQHHLLAVEAYQHWSLEEAKGLSAKIESYRKLMDGLSEKTAALLAERETLKEKLARVDPERFALGESLEKALLFCDEGNVVDMETILQKAATAKINNQIELGYVYIKEAEAILAFARIAHLKAINDPRYDLNNHFFAYTRRMGWDIFLLAAKYFKAGYSAKDLGNLEEMHRRFRGGFLALQTGEAILETRQEDVIDLLRGKLSLYGAVTFNEKIPQARGTEIIYNNLDVSSPIKSALDKAMIAMNRDQKELCIAAMWFAKASHFKSSIESSYDFGADQFFQAIKYYELGYAETNPQKANQLKLVAHHYYNAGLNFLDNEREEAAVSLELAKQELEKLYD